MKVVFQKYGETEARVDIQPANLSDLSFWGGWWLTHWNTEPRGGWKTGDEEHALV